MAFGTAVWGLVELQNSQDKDLTLESYKQNNIDLERALIRRAIQLQERPNNFEFSEYLLIAYPRPFHEEGAPIIPYLFDLENYCIEIVGLKRGCEEWTKILSGEDEPMEESNEDQSTRKEDPLPCVFLEQHRTDCIVASVPSGLPISNYDEDTASSAQVQTETSSVRSLVPVPPMPLLRENGYRSEPGAFSEMRRPKLGVSHVKDRKRIDMDKARDNYRLQELALRRASSEGEHKEVVPSFAQPEVIEMDIQESDSGSEEDGVIPSHLPSGSIENRRYYFCEETFVHKLARIGLGTKKITVVRQEQKCLVFCGSRTENEPVLTAAQTALTVMSSIIQADPK